MENENTPVDPVEVTTPVAEVHTEVVTEAVVETVPQPEPEPVIVETAHDDFDWSIGKQRINIYSEEERVKFLADYEESLRSLNLFLLLNLETCQILRSGMKWTFMLN